MPFLLSNGLEFCWRGLSGRKADGTTAYPPQQSYGRGSEPRRALFTNQRRSETSPSRLPAQQQFLVRWHAVSASRRERLLKLHIESLYFLGVVLEEVCKEGPQSGGPEQAVARSIIGNQRLNCSR